MRTEIVYVSTIVDAAIIVSIYRVTGDGLISRDSKLWARIKEGYEGELKDFDVELIGELTPRTSNQERKKFPPPDFQVNLSDSNSFIQHHAA